MDPSNIMLNGPRPYTRSQKSSHKKSSLEKWSKSCTARINAGYNEIEAYRMKLGADVLRQEAAVRGGKAKTKAHFNADVRHDVVTASLRQIQQGREAIHEAHLKYCSIRKRAIASASRKSTDYQVQLRAQLASLEKEALGEVVKQQLLVLAKMKASLRDFCPSLRMRME